MASIFTGLAFMHGHIVNKELVLALGAPERQAVGGGNSKAGADEPSRANTRSGRRTPAQAPKAQGATLVPGACC